MEKEEIKGFVKKKYAQAAAQDTSCCGAGDSTPVSIVGNAYTEREISSAPEGSNLSLGCGNPIAHAAIREGDTVLDLGSGAGFDCFLAALKVGDAGRVIGVDMTPEMVERAKANARKGGYGNVEFRLGEIEKLPVDDVSIDLVISNCVINLVPDKATAFGEAFRVLRPGGGLMVSDIVLLSELPDAIKSSVEAYAGCLAGAALKDDYLTYIEQAGFEELSVLEETSLDPESLCSDPLIREIVEKLKLTPDKANEIAGSIASMKISALKPE
ncbi:MAG: arsenite methyltransferase [Thermodesulfobacteriota bacterium]